MELASIRSRQDILDFVATHLQVQGKQASGGTGPTCLYRTRDGLKCALGALLPDENYNPHFDINSGEEKLSLVLLALPSNIIIAAGDVHFSHVDDVRSEFLTSLQVCHDLAATRPTTREWTNVNEYGGIAYKLRLFADQYDLNRSVINELWPLHAPA
jgi:hypothetical protein